VVVVAVDGHVPFIVDRNASNDLRRRIEFVGVICNNEQTADG